MQGSFIHQAYKLGISIGHVAIPDCKSGRVENVILLSALEYSRCCPSDSPFRTEVLISPAA